MVSLLFGHSYFFAHDDAAQPVVLLLKVTDRSNPSAITWLESTLPKTTSAYDNDTEDLKKLQEEVRVLEDELQHEIVRNTELREQVNASRSRSDEMVALMQLLRSETEAVLERFVCLFAYFSSFSNLMFSV